MTDLNLPIFLKWIFGQVWWVFGLFPVDSFRFLSESDEILIYFYSPQNIGKSLFSENYCPNLEKKIFERKNLDRQYSKKGKSRNIKFRKHVIPNRSTSEIQSRNSKNSELATLSFQEENLERCPLVPRSLSLFHGYFYHWCVFLYLLLLLYY